MAELKKRGDFPMTSSGSSQWRAYQKEHGLGAYAGGGQTSERGRQKADETVREGPPPAAAPVRGPNETQADWHARYRRWQNRSRPREHVSPRAEGQRRALKKKAEPTPSPTPEEEKE